MVCIKGHGFDFSCENFEFMSIKVKAPQIVSVSLGKIY